MLAAAVLEMMPVSATMTSMAPALVLAGYLLIHFVEHTVVRHFHFGEETHPEHVGSGRRHLGARRALHSQFLRRHLGRVGIRDRARLGLLLFVAIILHKAPEGFTIASIMLAGGYSRAPRCCRRSRSAPRGHRRGRDVPAAEPGRRRPGVLGGRHALRRRVRPDSRRSIAADAVGSPSWSSWASCSTVRDGCSKRSACERDRASSR